jgi:sulfate transport system permease protein
MGTTLLYLGLMILVPLSMVVLKTSQISLDRLWEIVASERALASYRLTFGASFIGAAVNLVFGLIVAWVLVRYDFPGRRLIDGLVDLPFALPTAVAGIALASVYAENGWLGKPLAELGIKVAYTPAGVAVALTFIGLPFVVRTVQPVLADLDPALEEASATLGASRLTTLARVVLPEVAPAAATGFVMALARALGEYGSVIFIAGNLPMKSEITALLIMVQLEQFDYPAATGIALVFLLASFTLLLLLNRISSGRRPRRIP